MFNMFTPSTAVVTSILLFSFCGQLMVTIGSAVETKELNGKSIAQERTDISAHFDGPFVGKYFLPSQCPRIGGVTNPSVEECLDSCLSHRGPQACTAVSYRGSDNKCVLRACTLPAPPPAWVWEAYNSYSLKPDNFDGPFVDKYFSMTQHCHSSYTSTNTSLRECLNLCLHRGAVNCTAVNYLVGNNNCYLRACTLPVSTPLWDTPGWNAYSLKPVQPEYYAVERGSLYSLDYKIFIIKNGLGPISPFHDIPLFANEYNKIFNMIVEIPRWTNAKMEINNKDELNCIKQDTKDDKVRYVSNCFPYKGYIWNYGALPQTWEDPNHIDESTGQKGDNDPIDVCEIGYRVATRGEILQVKVLGVLALIDEGEIDWKLIVIDINDPLAPQLNDINDVEEHMPEFLNATVDWFRIYKVPAGNPENEFAFNGEVQNREFAHQVILGTHEYWKALIEGRSESGGISTNSVTVSNAINKITAAEAQDIQDAAPDPGTPLPLDPEIDIWYYCR